MRYLTGRGGGWGQTICFFGVTQFLDDPLHALHNVHTPVCMYSYTRVPRIATRTRLYAPTRTCYGWVTLHTYACVCVPYTYEPLTNTTYFRRYRDTPTRAGHGCARIHTLEHTHSYTPVPRVHSNVRVRACTPTRTHHRYMSHIHTHTYTCTY